MKKVIGILVLQALMFAPAYGQFETPQRSDVNMVRGKTLLVETQDEVTRTLMDLEKDTAAQQQYKDGVANFNKMVKEVVGKYYKFGRKVEYMNAPDVATLMREGKASRYAVLHFAIQNSSWNPRDMGPIYGGEYNDSVREYSKSKGYGIISIELPGYNNKITEVYSVALPVAYPSAADLVYALQTMQYVFNRVIKNYDYQIKDFRAEMEKNNKKLKRVTLLIDKGQIGPKTTLRDLQEGYYLPIEIVDYKTIEDAILLNDSNFAYVQVIPVKAGASTAGKINVLLRDLVLDAKDGEILAVARPGRMNHEKIADDISRKEVKDFLLNK